MLQAYRQHAAERAALGIPPLPLDAKQVAELIELIKAPPAGEDAFLMDLLTHRVPPGVDDAAKVKASFLAAVAHGDLVVGLVSKAKATELLGTMVGGYNVKPLIDLLDDADVAAVAAEGLKKTLLMFDFFHDVAEKAKAGNTVAQAVIRSWADAEWFTSRPEVPQTITVTVFKVPGETNTDDLSPAPDAWSRPDIPLHYLAMLKNTRDGQAASCSAGWHRPARLRVCQAERVDPLPVLCTAATDCLRFHAPCWVCGQSDRQGATLFHWCARLYP